MNKDLYIIKKKFGETLSHLCKELFPLILTYEGLLSELMLKNFSENHSLGEDIIKNQITNSFRDYIYLKSGLLDRENKLILEYSTKTPQELLKEKGYTLYECVTEEEIQSFKKYYAKGEEICTFKTNRLEKCYVFFAVKDNVDFIKREKFLTPSRQDEYGTSVLSIQFTKDDAHMLSIKNRYNHKVADCDATFSNNLENIVPGLTNSFERVYGLNQKYINFLEIPGYVHACDDKFYKYNYELNGVYYCPNNIIIDGDEIIKLDKERYILFDYYCLDLKDKKIMLYDDIIDDSFANSIGPIDKVYVKKENKSKKIFIKPVNGDLIEIELDENNNMISLYEPNIKNVLEYYLKEIKKIMKVNLPNAIWLGNFAFANALNLTDINLPEIMNIDDFFLLENTKLKKIYLPNVREIGMYFLANNNDCQIYAPLLERFKDLYLYQNGKKNNIYAPKLQLENDLLNEEKIFNIEGRKV